ncbi:MAG TPA: hybrid sensor histidine kinase/response regulator [Cyanobacteria bacterium UBA9273]|nr:hybrid sensor histidine kinase/response regulator [Cyanobacteria bacterium UBA9273]
MNNKNPQNNKILVVDDNPDNLGILFDYLTNSGFKILVALDGESALKRVESAHPDIILLDVMMPKIDGFEVCRRLKANPSAKDIPVIFMSALSETVNKVRGFRMGAVDYITKPIKQEEVLSRVQTHLTIRNLQKQLQDKTEELARINQNLESVVETRTKQLIDQEKTAIIGRLTQGIVHNLKNPIQTILAYKSLAEEKSKEISRETLLRYTQKMADSAQQMNQILDNLMYKSKMGSSGEIKPLDINEVLRKELDFWQANFQFYYKVEKQYLFDSNLPAIPLVYADLTQVFDNLIANALDAMWDRKEQKLTLVTRQDQEQIYIDFQDTGCGIPSEKIPLIFDPFYTTKSTHGEEPRSGEPTGTGLGLYSCTEILKSFSGKIIVTSEVDRGSTFTVVLPKKNS